MKLTKEWLDRNLHHYHYSQWYIETGSNEVRLVIMVSVSDEVADGWYISLGDESKEVVIYEGDDCTIERFKLLYNVISGTQFIEK